MDRCCVVKKFLATIRYSPRGELGDAFIAFSTDEDARQAMMLDGGKIKEIQVKLLLSSRSEMHKVIEAARQSVPLLSLAAPAPVATSVSAPVTVPAPATVTVQQPLIQALTPFSAALGNNTLSSFGIPGIGNPQEIPQPAVIEPPAPLISPSANNSNAEDDKEEDKMERKRSREKDRRRTRSRSRSRDRERKDRKRDRRDRSRSRERRRRDRSRSRERRDRKRDRKDRSRSRDRSPSRRSRDRRNDRVLSGSQENSVDNIQDIANTTAPTNFPSINQNAMPQIQQMLQNNVMQNRPVGRGDSPINRFTDPSIAEAFNKLQELGKKRNPHAFQGEQNGNGGGRIQSPTARGGMSRGGGSFRTREGRPTRFENNEQQRDCCVAIRNAPNHTSYGDVRRFFPFLIDKHGIKMINDSMGRRTGNIYVRFCDPRSKQHALQRKSNELKGAEVLVETLDDSVYETAVDSFLPYREDNDEEETSLATADPEPKSQTPLSVIKMSDLPNFVKEHDIIKSFSDFSLLSIMLNDCRLTRTKTAYVQFVKPEDARLALERKDRYIFGRRTATVTTISVAEYEKDKLAQTNKSQEPQTNFPPQIEAPQEMTAPRDPRQRRKQVDNGPATKGVALQVQPQGAPFFSPPFVQQQGFPGQFPGQFGVFQGPGSAPMDPRTAASNWTNRPQFPNQMDSIVNSNVMSNDSENEPLDCVLMKGLPRDATDRTIVTFFSDTSAVPARIHLMLDTNGMPSGDCFCEFRSTQEARMAHTKHGKNLEGCRVTIDLVPRSVVEEALEGPKPQQDSLLGNSPMPPQQFFEPGPIMRGGGGFRGGFRGRGGFDRGGFDRGGFNRGGYEGRGTFRGRGNFNDRGRGFDRGRGRGRGFGRGGASAGGFNENSRNEDDHDPALDDFGAPGCVVSMENVPFRASIDDIMNFFSEFELTQDDVIRRYNERGQATGDARVAFRTPFDAQRAVKTRHMDMIHDRRISLCVL
ncbi:unnamed protein product [Arctia plantaginis]|uniref:RRM domain-containing protein n=1 Tax=Arctia plantaginis TaxID=874455 RepID=A0A8S1AI62_ARCPL|nr:unnamed protein product [Arctia plantaginis]